MKKLLFAGFCFLGAFPLLAMDQIGSTQDPSSIVQVSLVALLGNPDAYQGKYVRVSGYLTVKFENNSLCLSKEDAEHGIMKNALWLEFSPELQKGAKVPVQKFSKKYVLIEGIFNKDERGHLKMFSGSIKNVSRIMELEGRKD